MAFVKRHGANHSEDEETWEPADVARALNGMGQAGTNGALAVEPVAFETRVVRNGRGAPSDTVNALKAQAGSTGKGDAAPMAMLPATGTVRRLTPTECERLQGFPDGWTIQRK